jgi:hypothetical protein
VEVVGINFFIPIVCLRFYLRQRQSGILVMRHHLRMYMYSFVTTLVLIYRAESQTDPLLLFLKFLRRSDYASRCQP